LYGEEALLDGITISFGSKSLKFPLSQDDVDKFSELVESCAPSAFGMNERAVIDPSYRKCKELKPNDFTISNNYHEILPRIMAQAASVLESPKTIYASLNKLCVYETHGFFKEHVDTPQSDIFASLVVCLPTNYEGGMLTVEDNAYDLSSSNSIKWCAFYSDCRHKIDEVTKGFRVTLTYDLLYLDIPEPVPYHDLLYKTLESSLLELHAKHNVDPALTANQKPKFVIGIPLVSKYPSLEGHGGKPTLKGRDLKTLTILRDLGYTTDVKAVYNVKVRGMFRNRYYHKSHPSFEGIGDVYEEVEFTEDFEEEDAYVISDAWHGFSDEVNEECGDYPISALYDNGGRCLKNLYWLWEPTCRHAGPTYIAYGNEPSTGTVYMDGCILA
ncbi:hypothetical protein BGZ80_008029, partial [Entomortierella chlamydospora]